MEVLICPVRKKPCISYHVLFACLWTGEGGQNLCLSHIKESKNTGSRHPGGGGPALVGRQQAHTWWSNVTCRGQYLHRLAVSDDAGHTRAKDERTASRTL